MDHHAIFSDVIYRFLMATYVMAEVDLLEEQRIASDESMHILARTGEAGYVIGVEVGEDGVEDLVREAEETAGCHDRRVDVYVCSASF